MQPEILKTLSQLRKAREEAARLTRRIRRLNYHKMPLYWSVAPQGETYARAVENLLQESETELYRQLGNIPPASGFQNG